MNVDFKSALTQKRANPEKAELLKEAVFENVKGFTNQQVDQCEKKGAKVTLASDGGDIDAE